MEGSLSAACRPQKALPFLTSSRPPRSAAAFFAFFVPFPKQFSLRRPAVLESTAALWYPYAVFLCKGDDSVTKLRDKRLFLLDMDGTIYIWMTACSPAYRSSCATCARWGAGTSSSPTTPPGRVEALHGKAPPAWASRLPGTTILTSVDATVRYLRETLPGKTVLCVRHGFLPGPAGRSRYPRDPGPGAGGGASCAASTRSSRSRSWRTPAFC